MLSPHELEARGSVEQTALAHQPHRLELVPAPERKIVLGVGLLDPSRKALHALDFCDFVEVASIPDALVAIKDRGFDAIFLEAQLPGFTPSLVDQLRAHAPETLRTVIGPSELEEQFGELAEAIGARFLPLSLPAAQFAIEVRRILFPRKSSDRVSLDRLDWRVRAKVDGHPFEHHLLDLSNRGLSLAIQPSDYLISFVPGTTVTGLEITNAAGQVVLGQTNATVRHCAVEHVRGGPIVRVGLSFDPPTSTRAPHIRVINEIVPILTSIRKAARAGAAFTLTLPDAESGYRFATGEVAMQAQPELVLPGPAPADWHIHDVVRLNFSHHGQSYSGITSLISIGDHIRLALPRSMRVHHRRASNRHRPKDGRSYTATLVAPLTGSSKSYSVYDLNGSGFSVIMNKDVDLLPVGLVLDPIEIRLPERVAPIVVRGVVRSLTTIARRPEDHEGTPARCGIELIGLPEAERVRLSQALIADGFSHIETATEADFAAIWDFFKESGFTFHLYGDDSPESVELVRGGFGQVLSQGRPLAVSLIYRNENKIRGHISVIQIYSKTVLMTHLAALQGASAPVDRITRAICISAGEYAEQQPGVEFVRLNWSRDSPWPNRMFGWSGRAIHHPGLSDQREFGVMVRKNDAPVAPTPGVVVRPAEGEDLRRIEKHLLESMSLVRIQSEDLTLGTLDLKGLNERYQERGLYRRRHIRVAWKDGVRVGFAFIERTTPGVQIAEITNEFEVFLFGAVPPEDEQSIRTALIADAVDFYRKEGLAHSVAFADAPDQAAYLNAGFRVATVARSWIWHRSQLRQWTDVWDQLFVRGKDLFGPRRGH